MQYIILKAMNGKVAHNESIRDRMSPAESILYEL
jgi:hypothetical protein